MRIKLKIISFIKNFYKNKIIFNNCCFKINLCIFIKDYFIKFFKFKDVDYITNISIYNFNEIRLGEYLRVDKDTLWVTPEIWEQFQIMSNTSWQIS